MQQCEGIRENLQGFNVSLLSFIDQLSNSLELMAKFIFSSGEEGRYPDLEQTVEAKIRKLAPNR